jgi:hypothetical protein
MKRRNVMKVSTILSLIMLGTTLTLGGNAFAAKGAGGGGGAPPPAGGGGGGTVKPPAKNLVAPVFVPTLSDPLLPGNIIPPGGTGFTVAPAGVNGFDATGIIQNAVVNNDGCSGSATVDGKNIVIPCGLIVQMPANTMTWAAYVGGGVTPLEISLVGNKVGGTYIAALAYISQQSLHGLSGTITNINYANGDITVDGVTTIQINDPFGRFGRAQSPDSRFSVDDQNPTIHSGTGYPMCVPRSGPDLKVTANDGSVTFVKYPDNNLAAYATDINGIPQDPACPQNNRPLAAGGCRNFGASGFAPPVSGELSPPVFGQTYCSAFVMKAVPGAIVYPTGLPVSPFFAMAVPTDADPRIQAPFEVGDYITYSGTTMGGGGVPGGGGTFVSAHTIEANLGIYTQPGTQPSYLAIGEFGIGTADPTAAAAGTGVAQESTNRIFLEAETTDYRTPIDIYLVDDVVGGVLSAGLGIPPGGIINRWVTPWEMTGECPAAGVGLPPAAASCNGVTGGITTSLTGPQAMRDRIRAVKAPLGLLSRPSRTVRVMARSLCTPTAAVNGGPGLVDACLAAAPMVANGVIAGQYQAPVFEYIFPENVKAGDIPIPYDLWHLPFLRSGESSGSAAPALTPQPW